VVVARERLAEVLARAQAKEASEAEVMRRLQEGELTLDILGFRQALTDLGATL
jgi:regulator of RNase E activity RraA